MVKLGLKVVVLTVILEGASLMFLDEFVITALILVTIGLTTAYMLLRPEEPSVVASTLTSDLDPVRDTLNTPPATSEASL